jgi:hypothetical protein
MNLKITGISIIISLIIIFGATLFSYQQFESENNFQVYNEKIYGTEWNEKITQILPREGDLGKEWELMWSDSTEQFVAGENPIIYKKTITDNEIYSTSYNYSYKDFETYQILIWKGELVSNWIPKEAVENIFLQIDAKTEKTLNGLDLIPYCTIAYYDYYGEDNEIKNDLLFSECAKKDFRVRINLIEGEYNQENIEKMVFLSNLIIGKI